MKAPESAQIKINKRGKKMKETTNVGGFDFTGANWGDIEKQLEGGSKFVDTALWTPNKKVAGTYIFRFLPFVHNGKLNGWVTVNSHRFNHYPEGKMKLFYGICPGSKNILGKEKITCPICERGWGLYNTGIQANKDASDGWRPKQTWISNILVISDPSNPENEGKVFKYEYGISIFRLIQERLKPSDASTSDPDFKAFNPFHYESGKFKLKVTITETKDKKTGKVIIMPDYKQSSFYNEVTPISTNKDKVNEVLNSTYDLYDHIEKLAVLTDEKIQTDIGYLLQNQEYVPETKVADIVIEEDDAPVQETKTTKKGKGKAKADVDEEVKEEISPEMKSFFDNDLN